MGIRTVLLAHSRATLFGLILFLRQPRDGTRPAVAAANQLQPAGADAHCAAVRVGDRRIGLPKVRHAGSDRIAIAVQHYADAATAKTTDNFQHATLSVGLKSRWWCHAEGEPNPHFTGLAEKAACG